MDVGRIRDLFFDYVRAARLSKRYIRISSEGSTKFSIGLFSFLNDSLKISALIVVTQ